MTGRNDIQAIKRTAVRSLFPILVSLVIVSLVKDRIFSVDFVATFATLATFEASHWLTALALTAVSFYAISQYDRIAAKFLGLRVTRRDTLVSGWRATAIAQVMGYGLVTGALVRWRALGQRYDLSLWTCSKLTVLVTTCFFIGWATVTTFAVIIAKPAGLPNFATSFTFLALALLGTAALVLSLGKTCETGARTGDLSAILIYTLLDTLAACAIIYIFLPDGYVEFLTLLSAFLIAYVVGMTSGLPGGVGAFEISLIGLLGVEETAPLFSAVLAYRAVYFALPATLAGVTLLVHSRKPPGTIALAKHSIMPPWLQRNAPPEALLLSNGHLQLEYSETLGGGLLSHRAPHCEVILGDPFGGTPLSKIALASAVGQMALRPFCFYKCTDELSAWAKTQGYLSIRIGSEAYLDPQCFSLDGSAKRQLRRKLAKASKKSLKIEPFFGYPELLSDVDSAWRERNGAAKQFSMGSFDTILLSQERIWVAYIDSQPTAFISVMVSTNKWMLDLIRTSDDCPDGTTHSLVLAAIEAARDEKIGEFSLASAPFFVDDENRNISTRIAEKIFQSSTHLQGLHQFKACFAPHWRAEYLVSSCLYGAALGAFDIYRLIHGNPEPTNKSHNDYGFYEFASKLSPCHALRRMTKRELIYEHAQQFAAKSRLAFGRRRNRD